MGFSSLLEGGSLGVASEWEKRALASLGHAAVRKLWARDTGTDRDLYLLDDPVCGEEIGPTLE